MRSLSTGSAQATPGGRGNSLLRRFDATVGVGLLRALGALRRKRALDPAPRRIGLMKSTGIGDMILTTAIARDVIADFPDARVVMFAGADNAGIARLVTGGRRRAAHRQALGRDAAVSGGAARRDARLRPMDSARGALCGPVGGPMDSRVRHRGPARGIAPTTQPSPTRPRPRRSTTTAASQGARRQVRVAAQLRGRRAAPGAAGRGAVRGLPCLAGRVPQRAARVAGRLVARADRSRPRKGLRVVLTGGRDDVERTDEFIASCGGPSKRLESIAGRFGLGELIESSPARCVVSVNTGVMHLAAAAGTGRSRSTARRLRRDGGRSGRRTSTSTPSFPAADT